MRLGASSFPRNRVGLSNLPVSIACLRDAGTKPEHAREPRERPGKQEEDARVLACSACLRPITTAADRIAVSGSHEHDFANPEGLRFHIGCFATASNCTLVGPRSTYWSWFPPCTWQVELCGGCFQHLGWLFRNGGDSFHGLILDRLVEIGR